MIQDIAPSVYHNEYLPVPPNENDFVYAFDGRTTLVNISDGIISCPRVKDLSENERHDLQYLFRIDEKCDFLYTGASKLEVPGFSYETVTSLRRNGPKLMSFAGMTAYHLYVWYSANRFCGKCGSKTHITSKERSLKCDNCGNIIYPRISPAVIIGITDGDKIIMTRYADREYKGRSLVAGFCEMGETAEDTVRREVMEEVGLKVKNIRYYKSQPWGFDGGLLLGFFCDLDGSNEITLEEDELSIAEWISRSEITDEHRFLSLTEEMIMLFRDGKEPGRNPR